MILLETAATLGLYDGDVTNFCRFEDADAAIQSSNLLKQLWSGHPHVAQVESYIKLEDKLLAVRASLDRLLANAG